MLMPPASLMRRFKPTRYTPSSNYVRQWHRNTYNANPTNDLINADVPYTAYTVPNGYTAYYVDAAGGNDANNGLSSGAAWQTWDKAVTSAPDLACVILAAGTYYVTTGSTGPTQVAGRRLYYQPAPGAKVWIDGRDATPVTNAGWTVLGGGRWSIGNWGTSLANTYRWMAANGTDPAGEWINGHKRADGSNVYESFVNTSVTVFAAYPDQVTYGSKVLKWAASAAAVVSGTFFYDYTTGVMTVGDDPTIANMIRATKSKRWGNINGASTVVRGLGFRCAANHRDDAGALVIGASATTVNDNTFIFSQAGAGLRIGGFTNVDVERNTFAWNGRGGISGTLMVNPTIRYNTFVYNNHSREAAGLGRYKTWDAGGIKLTQTARGTVSDNFVEYNSCPGLWLDISCSDVTVGRNEVRYNANHASVAPQGSHGIFVEESARCYPIDNIVYGNDGYGIQVSGSNDSEPWNNTAYDNVLEDVSFQETAQSDTPDAEAITRGVTMDTTNARLVNNILAKAALIRSGLTQALMRVVNSRTPVPAGTGASTMLPSQDDNLYYRALATHTRFLNWRDDGASADTAYTTLAAHQAANGTWREAHGSEADNVSVVHPYFVDPEAGDFRILTSSRPTTGGVMLPPNLCNRIGITKGSQPDIGAFHRGRSSALVYLAQESFNRAAAAATWGTADFGGAWTLSGTAADFTTDGFVGKMALTASSTTREAYLTQAAPKTGTALVRVKTDKLAVGGNLHAYVVLRRSATANYEYRARLRFATDGTVYVACTKLEGSATESVVGAESAAIAGLTHATDTWYWVKGDISGTGTTTINLMVWQDGTPEPFTWTATITDSTPHANIQGAGYAGVAAATGAGVSNSPVVVSFDEFTATATRTYILRDNFSVAATAPLSGTAAMDTVGSWSVLIDDESRASKSGSELRLDKRQAGNNGTPSYYGPSTTRALGRGWFGRIRAVDATGQIAFGWDNNQSAFLNCHALLWTPGSDINAQILSVSASQCVVGSTATSSYEVGVVLLDLGAVYLWRAVGTTVWTIAYIDRVTNSSPVFPAVANYGTTTAYVDDVREIDLQLFDGRFLTGEGLAIDRKAVSAANDTISANADGFVFDTFTAATGVTKNILVRYVDDNNCIVIRCNQTAATVSIIEKVAGVETSKGSAAQTWTNLTSFTVKVMMDAALIRVFVADANKVGWSSASTFQTQTGAKTDHIGSEFKSYPRTITLPRM